MAKHGGIKDSGEYFVITPASRKVTVPHAHKSIATVGDHNSEQITFVCPQIVDGHDISQCASRYVTWQNVNGEVGHDELHIVQVEQGAEGMLYLAWTIRNGLTVAKGIVQFSVHFEDFDDDGATLYRWSTATCKDCDILDSVNAVLGAYQAVYVAGDTLVFADYNVVKDGVLEIKTNGLIPEGTLQINENGTFPVGEYAEVNVSVHTKDDPDFIPENIKKGVNILGIEGAYDPLPLVSGTIFDDCDKGADKGVGNPAVVMWYSGTNPNRSEESEINLFSIYAFNDSTGQRSVNTKFVKDSILVIAPYSNVEYTSGFDAGYHEYGKYHVELSGNVSLWSSAPDGSLFVLQVGKGDFSVRLYNDYSAIG